MHTRRYIPLTTITVGLAFASLPYSTLGQETAADLRRMRNASAAEQASWINAHLSAGMPPSEIFGDLILNKSEVTLPLIEQKIEQVLRSPSSPDNFIDKSVDPQKFVDLAGLAIIEAGDGHSLREVSKLIKIDEKRFGHLVDRTLIEARSYRNPFIVAYQGLEIGDPAVESRIVSWAKLQLDLLDNKPLQRTPGPPEQEAVREYEDQKNRTWWAEAMVNKYGGVPSEAQWRSDPIVSRLKPAHADSVHDSMIRMASEVVEKRAQSSATPPR